MTDLKKRLRERRMSWVGAGMDPDPICIEAADRIEQLEAELQAQRESTDIFRKLANPKTQEPERFKAISFGAKQKKCTTDGCTETTIDHIIMGGIGSDYCIDCADKIIAKYKGERS